MQFLKSMYGKVFAFLVMTHFSTATWAASQSLGDNDVKVSDLISDFLEELAWWKILLIAIFAFGGLYLAVTGIWGAIQANDQAKAQDFKMKTQVAKILGGVALISVGFLIMVIGNTFFGTGETIEQHYYAEEYRNP